MRRPLASFGWAFVGFLVGACTPCAGVLDCRNDATRVVVEGRILETETGAAVRNAVIRLVVGSEGADDSASVITDEDGLFSVSVPRVGTPSRMTLRIATKTNQGYSIDSLPCVAITQAGEPCLLDPVVDKPRFPIFLFRYRNDFYRPLKNALVTFKPTGGPALFGPGFNGSVQVTTDTLGVGLLFGDGVFANGSGPVIGDLTVEFPGQEFPATVHHGYKVRPVYWFGQRPALVQMAGPWLAYTMLFSDSATKSGVSGVSIHFERTSGIHAIPDVFDATSNADGLTGLSIRPITNGTIFGNLTIRPTPGAVPTVITDIPYPTFDADSTIFWSHWLIGATGTLYRIKGPP